MSGAATQVASPLSSSNIGRDSVYDLLHIVTIVRIGLVLNLLGTLFVAFSFGQNLEEAYQEDEKGRRIYLASFLHPTLFNVGLILLGLGFVLQLFA